MHPAMSRFERPPLGHVANTKWPLPVLCRSKETPAFENVTPIRGPLAVEGRNRSGNLFPGDCRRPRTNYGRRRKSPGNKFQLRFRPSTASGPRIGGTFSNAGVSLDRQRTGSSHLVLATWPRGGRSNRDIAGCISSLPAAHGEGTNHRSAWAGIETGWLV